MQNSLRRRTPVKCEAGRLRPPVMSDHYKEGDGSGGGGSGSGSGRRKKSKSSKSSSSSANLAAAGAGPSAPKGILKNSDPYAPYHNKRESLDELVENERPRSASKDHSSHSHRHRHSSGGGNSREEKQHKKHRSKSGSERGRDHEDANVDAQLVEEKNRRNHRHHHGGSGSGSGGSGSGKEKRHKSRDEDGGGGGGSSSNSSGGGSKKRSGSGSKKRSSSSKHGASGEFGATGEGAAAAAGDIYNDEGGEHDEGEEVGANGGGGHGSARRRRRRRSRSPATADAAAATAAAIYDQPKVPAVKYLHAKEGNSAETAAAYSSEDVNRIYKAIVKAAEASNGETQFYENLGYGDSGGSGGFVPIGDLGEEEEEEEDEDDPAPLYDVPKNNKPVVESVFVNEDEGLLIEEGPDAIYVNDSNVGAELSVDVDDIEALHAPSHGLKPLSELIPRDYDVPKIRDSLSTIEEEHQEYDIPRSSQTLLAVDPQYSDDTGVAPSPPPQQRANDDEDDKSSDGELYQNQGFALKISSPAASAAAGQPSNAQKAEDRRQQIADLPPQQRRTPSSAAAPAAPAAPAAGLYPGDARAYLNEFTAVANVNSHVGGGSGSGSGGDDRSSGYRSSSSPSIQSTEELYVNESAVTLMEADLDSCGSSQKHSSPEPNTRDIAIETTLERHKESREGKASRKKEKKEKKDGKEERKKREKELAREAAREKERAKAEEIEKEIRKKREEAGRFQRPLDFFNRKAREKSEKSREKFFDDNADDNADDSDEYQEEPAVTAQVFRQQAAAVAELETKFYPVRPESPFAALVEKQPKAVAAEEVEETKLKQQKDRSVDVYHETVRQRASRAGGRGGSGGKEPRKIATSKDVFAKMSDAPPPEEPKVAAHTYAGSHVTVTPAPPPPPPPPTFDNPVAAEAAPPNNESSEVAKKGWREERAATAAAKPVMAPLPPSSSGGAIPSSSSRRSSVSEDARSDSVSGSGFDCDDDDMPNVKELRNKFESGSGKEGGKNKKFMVMASLTRRGAMAMSRSLQNVERIAEENEAEAKRESKQKKGSKSGSKKEPREGAMGANSACRSEEKLVDDQSIFTSSELKFEKRGYNKSTARSSSKAKAPAAPGLKKTGTLKFGDDKETEEEIHKPIKVSGAGEFSDEDHEDDDCQQWDPIRFVSRMYRLPKLAKDEVAKNSADAAHIQGFLERLPPGKKKSTLWNSWKKYYFVAQKGFLNIYADDTCSVSLERIELFGGQVDFTDAHILGVQDRRGHYLVLKCRSPEEAQRWERALKVNIGQDFAKTFVTPSPRPRAPSFFSDIVVIDFGGASVRAGVATTFPTLPQLFFPSVMAVEHLNEQAKYFGLDTFAPEVRSRCRLSHPIVPSHFADKHSVDQTALQGILEKIFKDLNMEPSEYQVQLSVPRTFGDSTKTAIAAMLFDEFGVKALNMAHQSIFAFYSYSARSGIMVDLGERMDVVPIVDGYKVQSGISRSVVGGAEMRSKMQHYLLGRNYSLTSFIDGFITRYALEQSAYMSRHFDRELDAYHQEPAKIDRAIVVASDDSPDAPVKRMELGSERFEACEGLFKPELWGLDQAGVHVLVHKAIKECSMDARKEVTQSIFLAGGLTLIPGLRERLEAEVEKLTPVKPRVHASPYRYHAAYLGAVVHASSEAFRKTRVTKSEWRSGEAKVDRTWTM